MLQDVGATLGFLVMVTAPALLAIRRVRVRDMEKRTAYKAQLQG